MEQYESAEALDAHGKADYFREANKVLGTLVAAAPEIELLDTV
jgi:quinol monooxygenase YgiN